MTYYGVKDGTLCSPYGPGEFTMITRCHFHPTEELTHDMGMWCGAHQLGGTNRRSKLLLSYVNELATSSMKTL